MKNDSLHNEPNMEDMKKNILQAGSMFYQYRPCRRDASTIYDIDNIRHGVVYAQTPVNMNDPFDSMMGFSAEKIYENIISMLTDALEVDENTKVIIRVLLQYRAFGKIGELISLLKEQQQYLIKKRNTMHQKHISFDKFVVANANLLYSKAPKKYKSVFTALSFLAFSLLISQMDKIEISEENISQMLKMDNILDDLHTQAKNIRDSIYVPQLKKFLSTLTISCFSASGWDNQLMWSHYANSYSGICVQYDFSKIKDFIGFIYPVNYTTERPTLSMQDLGINAFDLKADDKIIRGDTNIANLFSYLLCKNLCWKYEDEWRIIDIGEENTPRFIDLPFIKSVTFGVNTDLICKKILLDICKEKDILCYELILSKDNYKLSRIPIADLTYDIDEEVKYITLLSDQMCNTSQLLAKNTEAVSKAFLEGTFDSSSYINVLTEIEDYLCNSYFLKSSLNRVCENADEDLLQGEMPNNIISSINGIESFVLICTHFLADMQKNVLGLSFKGVIKRDAFILSRKHHANIKELIERFNGYPWNSMLLNDEYNKSQVKQHYDLLVDENNDPVHDPDDLSKYMEKWDGQEFIKALNVTKHKEVLEVGVGTGRLAIKVAPLCNHFTGIDFSQKNNC